MSASRIYAGAPVYLGLYGTHIYYTHAADTIDRSRYLLFDEQSRNGHSSFLTVFPIFANFTFFRSSRYSFPDCREPIALRESCPSAEQFPKNCTTVENGMLEEVSLFESALKFPTDRRSEKKTSRAKELPSEN